MRLVHYLVDLDADIAVLVRRTGNHSSAPLLVAPAPSENSGFLIVVQQLLKS
jgi:hypothetical protein